MEFLRHFLKLKVSKEDIEKYKSEYITKNYKTKELDIIYKLKDKEIYYIIEQQTKVDKNMVYRMLNYCIEVMRDRIENNKTEIYPTIIPIVIYTGERKWKAEKEFERKQKLSEEEYKEYKIKFSYKLVDINKYSEEELLRQQTNLANIMLIEKSKNKEEMVENIRKIIENTKDINKIIELRKYIVYVQEKALEEKEEEILKMIEEKVGNDKMSTLIERLKKENEEIRKEGRLEELITTIKNMLKYGEAEEKIKKYTNATDEQIEQGKKELKLNN